MERPDLYSVLVQTLERNETPRESIAKLKRLWQSLDVADAFPCPLCFALRDTVSPLRILPVRNGQAPLICEDCEEMFFVPVERSAFSSTPSLHNGTEHSSPVLTPATSQRELSVAYVTSYRSSDIRVWSGTGYHIYMALQDSGLRTESIENLRDTYGLFTKAKKAVYSALSEKTYLRDRELATVKSYAHQVERALASSNCDVVFSPGTIPIAYLRTDRPIVFWTDSTFSGVIDFNPSFRNLCAETVKNGNKLEQAALSRCRLAIYCSDWAARTAIKYYDVDPSKVKVVPFGANVRCDRDVGQIGRMIARKNLNKCRLLFVGVTWFDKGGDVALQVTKRLRRRGLKAELHVVGCEPPPGTPDFVKVHGFISKETEAGRKLLDKLYSESHFLIVPSRAECFGVVFAEASSFGLPSLATHIGGIPTAIRNDKNGQTFALDEDPERYCDYILDVMSSKQAYKNLALSSFKEYTERLNWTSAGRRVRMLIAEHCRTTPGTNRLLG